MTDLSNKEPNQLPQAVAKPFKRLKKNLSFTGRFQWIFAVFGDSSLRQRIFEHLSNTVDQKIVSLSDLQDIFEFENLIESAAKETSCLHLVDTRHLFDKEDSNWPNLLNLHREVIAEKAPVNLVFWMDDDHLTFLAKNAPDFWNWRSSVYDFMVADGKQRLVQKQLEQIENLTKQLRRPINLTKNDEDRLVELSSRLEQNEASTVSDADLLVEFAQLLAFNELKSDDALIHLNKALFIFRQNHDKDGEALVYSNIAAIYEREFNNDSAAEYLEKALKTYNSINDEIGQAATLVKLANLEFKKAEQVPLNDVGNEHLSIASNKIKKALEIYNKHKDRHGIVSAAMFLAELEYKAGNVDIAENYYRDLIEICIEFKFNDELITAEDSLADLLYNKPDLEGAEKHFMNLADSIDKDSSPQLLAHVFFKLGRVQFQTGKIDAAIESLEKSQQVSVEISEELILANIFFLKGYIYVNISKTSEALYCYKEALTYYEKLKIPLGSANVYRELGDISVSLGEYDSAQTNYHKAQILYQVESATDGVDSINQRLSTLNSNIPTD